MVYPGRTSGYSPPDRMSVALSFGQIHQHQAVRVPGFNVFMIVPLCNVWLEAPLPVMQPDLTHREAELGIINDTHNLSLSQTGDLNF